MQTQTTTPVEVMVNTQPQTVTPDQDRVHCLAYHISARILNDAFAEDEAPAVHLIANALELDAGERRKLFDFMQDFIWDLKQLLPCDPQRKNPADDHDADPLGGALRQAP